MLKCAGVPPVVQQVKNMVLPQLWLRFVPWPGKKQMPSMKLKKKKKKKKKEH